jgi:hypothetical protein
MVSFTDKEMAIAACPTKASICGEYKLYEFKQSLTGRDTTAKIQITPPKDDNGKVIDCSLSSPTNDKVCFTHRESCTYVIKARCLAPGFSTASDNTMTSAMADIQVLEWDSRYVTYDPTETTKYNVKQYVGPNLGRSDLSAYNLWPQRSTDWVNKDD